MLSNSDRAAGAADVSALVAEALRLRARAGVFLSLSQGAPALRLPLLTPHDPTARAERLDVAGGELYAYVLAGESHSNKA